MNSLTHFDYLKSINADYIDELYARYLQNPDSVDDTWRYFFDGVFVGEVSALNAPKDEPEGLSLNWENEVKVFKLIQAYREQGHLLANTNPLFPPKSTTPELDLTQFGLTAEKLNETFHAASFLGLEPCALSTIIEHLKRIYCGPIGLETLQLQNATERNWIEKRFESLRGKYRVPSEDQKFILKRLTESETLERFIHTRYVAQKRFSIEGGEALIPALDCLVETAATLGAQELIMGMAHRGRLNVLVNVFGKKPEHLFTEFDDNYKLSTDHGEGDVKYHKGNSIDFTTRQGKSVHLSMGFNPSHLEFINPVIIGMAKAKQHQRNDASKTKVMSVLIHGDAAFAGQGVVYETLQASLLESYGTGGTVHIISNNQVGFTTDPIDSRSTRYCTDLARMLDAPIFHVNGDDPEALWIVTQIATEFRYQFKKDVFIDLVCYRKYGHNEGDEPSFTQPQLYKTISTHPTPRDFYAQRLAKENVVSIEEAKTWIQNATDPLQNALDLVRAQKPEPQHSEYQGHYWSKFHTGHKEDAFLTVNTGITHQKQIELSDRINRFPAEFKIHSKLERMFEARIQAVQTGQGIDWGNAEVLAYAALIDEGISVRMTGQDVQRGTFTHRHATVTDFNNNKRFTSINELNAKAKLIIHNSHLSETAAMGFEYGWSVADPDTLVIWEAQFGDFANGAQVMIDQFIATSETKWHRANGLTLLLPHGFEGQGPEHSSARLERFLQLCGRFNMTVAHPTTPAQIFHLLRRQAKRNFRKPLIVMTPKSLLRNPKALSTAAELAQGTFQEVIDDPTLINSESARSAVDRIMICSGKIFYELLDERQQRQNTKTAIIRLEQMYPWPEQALAHVIEKYKNATEVFYVQEEPRNMGAWMHFQGMWTGALDHFGARFPKLGLTYVGREICASPAVGSKKLHDFEQKEILTKAFQD
jgi:2-oxoglutarate dehydrogenase E1 component